MQKYLRASPADLPEQPLCKSSWNIQQCHGIASDVVKVEGEDPAPPGCLREVRVRRYVGDSQSWVRIS